MFIRLRTQSRADGCSGESHTPLICSGGSYWLTAAAMGSCAGKSPNCAMKPKPELIVLDLDGTLVDSAPDFADSIMHGREG